MPLVDSGSLQAVSAAARRMHAVALQILVIVQSMFRVVLIYDVFAKFGLSLSLT